MGCLGSPSLGSNGLHESSFGVHETVRVKSTHMWVVQGLDIRNLSVGSGRSSGSRASKEPLSGNMHDQQNRMPLARIEETGTAVGSENSDFPQKGSLENPV